jgi:hypothetical protein
MTSNFWEQLESVNALFIDAFSASGTEVSDPAYDYFAKHGWVNQGWTSPNFKLAHVNLVDARETRGLWMLHCCIFPHLHNDAPIFGFDIIASRHKITGCFHDFSSAGNANHRLIHDFNDCVGDLEWKRERKLPEWAEKIFSPHMVAAGNISKPEEINQLFDMVYSSLHHYLENVGNTNNVRAETATHQNFYCATQKLNPHNARVMKTLGLSDDEVNKFINECMFPEIIV